MTEEQPTPSRLDALESGPVGPAALPALRSAIVRKLRWILPVAAAGILAALMVWPKIEIELSEKRFEPVKIDRATLEKAAHENRLTDATFSSLDSAGRPFSILAAQAVQDSVYPDRITLDTPRGTLTLGPGDDLSAHAESGLYLQKDQILNLAGGVVITRSDGTVMNAPTMIVNLLTHDAHTRDAVSIKGPQGTLSAASGMLMREDGAVTIFGGPIVLTLLPRNSINPKGTQP